MSSSTSLVRHQPGNDSAATICPSPDQILPVVRAGFQAYRDDMRESHRQTGRLFQTALEQSRESVQDMRAICSGSQQIAQLACAEARQSIESNEKACIAATSSNQQVALAAIQMACHDAESMERIALNTQGTAREDREARKNERLQELEMQLAEWKFIHQAAEKNSVVQFAKEKVKLLTSLIQDLRDQKQREIVREKESLSKIVATSTLRSRTGRINLAKSSIKQSLSSSNDNKLFLPQILSCVMISCLISYYFGSYKTTMATVVLGGTISYKAVTYYSDLSNKKKWLGVYLRALEKLTSEPQLKVRSAVNEVLDNDLSIHSAQKNSPETKKILDQIPDAPVTGDPDETTSSIPRELAFLVDHATRQPLKTFSHL